MHRLHLTDSYLQLNSVVRSLGILLTVSLELMPYVYFISCFCLPNTACVCLHLNKFSAEVLVSPLVISGQNVVMSQFQYFKNGVLFLFFFFFNHSGSFNFKRHLLEDFFFIWNSQKSICCSLLTRVEPGKKKKKSRR